MQLPYNEHLPIKTSASAEPITRMNTPKTITLALTGASGMPYAMRLLESLLKNGNTVYLLYSQVAQIVAKQEMGLTLPSRSRDLEALLTEQYSALPGRVHVFGREEWFAPVASGSNPADAMIVCPCTMGTLAAIANGLSDNLIERAADVMIKENRQLILVPRETPFSANSFFNLSAFTLEPITPIKAKFSDFFKAASRMGRSV